MKKMTEKKVYSFVLLGSIIFFVLTNIFFSLASSRWKLKVDTTANRLYKLSDTTKDIISGLSSETIVYVLEKEANYPAVLRELLSRYELSSEKLSVKYIDPYENPVFLDTYMQQGISLSESDIIVVGSSGIKRIGYDELLIYSGDSFKGIDMEQRITSAILYVNSDEHRTVLFTSGHNERSTSALLNVFESNSYMVNTMPLTSESAAKADIIVIASPTRDLTETEISELSSFLGKGGKLMVFLEPGINSYPILSSLLNAWNIEVDNNVVFDSRNYVNGNQLNIIPLYTTHEINSYFADNQYYMTVPSCRSLRITGSSGEAEVKPVLVSSSFSYAKTGVQYVTTDKEEGDADGSFILAAVSEKKIADGKSAKIFVVGSRYIYSDDIMKTDSFANSEFITQVSNYMTGSSSGVNIASKMLGSKMIAVSRSQEFVAGLVLVVLIPIAVLATGLAMHIKREKL